MILSVLTKRLARPVALVVAVLVIGGACDARDGETSNGDLVWAIGSVEGETARHIAEMWNDRHAEGPKVRVVELPESADDQRQLMAIEQNAGLETIDVLTLDVVWTGEFAEKGWLTDLADVSPEIRGVSSPAPLQSATWNEQLWAAPFTTNVSFLYYRTDLVPDGFAANPPKTWGALVATASDVLRTQSDPNLGGFVGQGAQYEGMVVNYLEYVWGAGGDLLNAEGSEATFEPGPAHQAAQFMKDSQANGFYADGFETMNENGALERFASGKAVFMRNWTYAYDELKKSPVSGKVGIAPLPTFTGNGTTPAIGGQNLAVSRFSRNPPEAKEFVTFAASNYDVQRYLANVSRAPAMAAIYSDPSARVDPAIALIGEVLPSARARPSTSEWAAISAEIQQELYPVYAAQQDPDDALRAIRSYLERAAATN